MVDRVVAQLLLILIPLISILSCDSAENPNEEIQSRVNRLLGSMTLEEKVSQLFAGHGPQERFLEKLKQSGMGGVKFSMTLGFDVHSPEELVRTRNALQRIALNSTAGIPLFFYDEGDHVATVGGTIFPMPIGQGCSWNTSLVKSIASALAAEASSVGVDTLFAPVVNMVSDPRFGRLQENFSENPILTARMAVASVLGLQNAKHGRSVAALGKHFAAYGDASGGLNGGASAATERMLFDIYLRPWKSMASAGLKGLMPAHNTVLHIPCHANTWLLNATMRNLFQFNDGLMLSDCNDIGVLIDFRMASNISHAASIALKAGLDLDLQCEKDEGKWAYNHLIEALNEMLITERDIDNSVRRVLSHKFEMGLFDERTFTDETTAAKVLDNEHHRKLAREAAEQSIVLLLNRNNTLPVSLNSSITSILLVGPTASRMGCNCSEAESSLKGSYSFSGARVVTLDEALQKSFPDIKVTWAKGCDGSGPVGSGVNETELQEAATLAKASDLTIFVLGDVQGGCGEWEDRDSLDLQGSQLALLRKVAPVSKKNVVVLVSGRVVTFGDNNSVLTHVDAMFAAWRPGEEFGNALIRLLTGEVNPSAKLAVSWPRSVGHVGSGSVPWLQEVKGKWIYNKRGSVDNDGRRYNNYVASSTPDPTPLFYFGFGLSYTTFRYDSISIQNRLHSKTIMWDIKVTLSNVGTRDGEEVIQIYVQDPVGVMRYVPFWKRLVGFTRCFLPAQASRTCELSVLKEDIASYDAESKTKMRIYGGVYNVTAGGSSSNAVLSREILVDDRGQLQQVML